MHIQALIQRTFFQFVINGGSVLMLLSIIEMEKSKISILLYNQRYAIERTSACMDSFRSLLNRFDITVSNWKSLNYIAFMIILFKKIKNNKKSR